MKYSCYYIIGLILFLASVSPLDAADVSGWCPEGQKAFSRGNYEEANLALSSCLYEPPENPELASQGYFLRGETYFDRLDYVAALSDLDLAVELWPENAEAWRTKSWVHYKQEDYLAAIQAITNSLEADPHNTESNHVHASILTAMGRQGQAMDAYDLAYSFETRQTVEKLQRALNGEGFTVGNVDGVYGSQTREALKACIAAGCILSM